MELLANIDVDDVAVATEFYCRALNLTVGRKFGDAGIELLGASSAIYLLEKPRGSIACNAPGSARNYSRHWTPVHLDFVVPAVQELYEAEPVTKWVCKYRDVAPRVRSQWTFGRCAGPLSSRAG